MIPHLLTREATPAQPVCFRSFSGPYSFESQSLRGASQHPYSERIANIRSPCQVKSFAFCFLLDWQVMHLWRRHSCLRRARWGGSRLRPFDVSPLSKRPCSYSSAAKSKASKMRFDELRTRRRYAEMNSLKAALQRLSSLIVALVKYDCDYIITSILCGLPLPATVVMIFVFASTRRIRLLTKSAM